jgi:hypothetical protein
MALTQVSKDVLNNSQANITQVGTLSSLTVSGNISSANYNYANGVGILESVNSSIATLTSNAAVQAGLITNTNTAITTANTAMKGYVDAINSTLTANAGAQAGSISTLTTTKANLSGAAFTGNISTTANVKFAGWQIYEVSNTLYFAHNGAVKMSLNTSGNLTVSGDIAGFGTP